MFAYPKEVKPVEVKGPTKLVTAVLSTTRKAKRFQEKRAKEKEGSLADSMDVVRKRISFCYSIALDLIQQLSQSTGETRREEGRGKRRRAGEREKSRGTRACF